MTNHLDELIDLLANHMVDQWLEEIDATDCQDSTNHDYNQDKHHKSAVNE